MSSQETPISWDGGNFFLVILGIWSMKIAFGIDEKQIRAKNKFSLTSGTRNFLMPNVKKA